MKRLAGLVSSVAVLAAVTACGVFADDGPPRHTVVLPEPAPPSAQWIVDAVDRPGLLVKQCPKPTLATLAVLDDDGHSRAVAFWLKDNLDVCWVHLGDPWDGTEFIPIDDQTRDTELVANGVLGPEQYLFIAFSGRQDDVKVTGDTDHVAAPPRFRAVDLGGGRFVTFAEFRLLSPTHGEDLTVYLCPTSGDCHYTSPSATEFPTLPTPESSPKSTP
ncbi:hypothetical protein [Kitasatospora sp. NPDC059827]|uniref:hypothetical protein n=1 Tax=Kitasatospora sp. NPDC059827 TaxID=3346964 RepID=UPI00364FB913